MGKSPCNQLQDLCNQLQTLCNQLQAAVYTNYNPGLAIGVLRSR